MKKNSIAIVCILGLIALLHTGCYNDKAEYLYPDTNCDTSAVKYSTTIVPVLSSYCISCHGGSTPSAAISLDTYNAVAAQATSGRLWGAVSHSISYSPMPKNAAKLSACNLAKIKKWLDAGHPNN